MVEELTLLLHRYWRRERLTNVYAAFFLCIHGCLRMMHPELRQYLGHTCALFASPGGAQGWRDFWHWFSAFTPDQGIHPVSTSHSVHWATAGCDTCVARHKTFPPP